MVNESYGEHVGSRRYMARAPLFSQAKALALKLPCLDDGHKCSTQMAYGQATALRSTQIFLLTLHEVYVRTRKYGY